MDNDILDLFQNVALSVCSTFHTQHGTQHSDHTGEILTKTERGINVIIISDICVININLFFTVVLFKMFLLTLL